jgi:hypothetical protein
MKVRHGPYNGFDKESGFEPICGIAYSEKALRKHLDPE